MANEFGRLAYLRREAYDDSAVPGNPALTGTGIFGTASPTTGLSRDPDEPTSSPSPIPTPVGAPAQGGVVPGGESPAASSFQPTTFPHATTSSSISSTLSSSPTGLADSSPTSTSDTSSTFADSMKINGLIAGIAVLGTLFLVMTGVLIWTLRRKRSRRNLGQPETSFQAASKDSLDPSLAGLESTIASLETQLHEKDTQLRERHVSMIAKGQSINQSQTTKRMSIQDDELRERFVQLQNSVSKWVSMYFGASKFTATPIPDAVATLKKTFPQYASLIKENAMVTTILEGLVVDMISQSFASGQLLGNETFWELKQVITSTVSTSEANEWRAMTIRLLERTPNYQSDRKEAVEDLSQMIDAACSELTKTRPKGERRASLEQIVDSAASLALDMAKQRAMFRIERPSGSTFDPEMMEGWNTDTEAVAGAPIRAVIFPAVTKCGGESISGVVWDNSLVIIKAKVLL